MNSRWIKITLVVSLAINLVLIGAIVGRISAGSDSTRPFPPHLGWVLRSLDSEKRQQLKPKLREQARDTRQARQQLRETQQAVTQLLLEDPLDEAALKAKLETLRSLSAKSQQDMHTALLGIMGQLSAAEREQAVQFLNQNWGDEMRGHRPKRQHPGLN